jgi:hypothetical protein
MPARSILSKHITHLAAWSVSTALLSYFSSRRRADGVRAKHAARQILQSRLNSTEDRITFAFCCGCMSLLLALNGHPVMSGLSPLSGAKRTQCAQGEYFAF